MPPKILTDVHSQRPIKNDRQVQPINSIIGCRVGRWNDRLRFSIALCRIDKLYGADVKLPRRASARRSCAWDNEIFLCRHHGGLRDDGQTIPGIRAHYGRNNSYGYYRIKPNFFFYYYYSLPLSLSLFLFVPDLFSDRRGSPAAEN